MESQAELPLPQDVAQPARRPNRGQVSSSISVSHSALLLLSTAVAALFCYLYLTKPSVVTLENPNIEFPAPPPAPVVEQLAQPIPQPIAQPVAQPTPDTSSSPQVTKAPMHGGLEETNLRVQHVLTAETAGGRIDRIELNVPILYQSRALRWTDAEVVAARQLHEQLVLHQEQSRALREQGRTLLAAWNDLITRSIPNQALRADSPSLPENQRDAIDSPRPAGWTSTDLIEIKTSEP